MFGRLFQPLKRRRSVERKITLVMAIAILAFGCFSPKPTRYETSAYKSASPENRLRIEEGKIVPGMSVEECKVSCPDCQFERKFVSTKGDFEVWEVTGRGKDLYLRVQNGKIENVSENTAPSPRDKKKKKIK
jgi:hypothetical protein